MSWWVGLSRIDFAEHLTAEGARMAYAGKRPILTWEITIPSNEIAFLRSGRQILKATTFAVVASDLLNKK